jgi:hypothetical protein
MNPKSINKILDFSSKGLVSRSSNPVWKAIAKRQVSSHIQTSIGLTGRKALYALCNGFGTLENVNDLLLIAYAGLILAEQGFGNEYLGDVNAALNSIVECRKIGASSGRYEIEALNIFAIADLLELHEQQMKLTTEGDLSSAMIEASKRALLVFGSGRID